MIIINIKKQKIIKNKKKNILNKNILNKNIYKYSKTHK